MANAILWRVGGFSNFCKRDTENVQEAVSLPADFTSDVHLEML